MKVVYQKKIIEQLMEVRRAALLSRQEVEYVGLSVREVSVLLDELRFPLSSHFAEFESWLNTLKVCGISKEPQPTLRCCGFDIKVQV
jgi:hypothetical protein